ncbi:MAG: hypothetical protein H7333_02325, partial [Bdellovibrionales bacterium]|nr:hypothetical protein [Oligoflexia bacterium]
REDGNPTERSEIAWNHTLDLTRRIATVKVDPVLETMAIETRFDPERIVEAEVQID